MTRLVPWLQSKTWIKSKMLSGRSGRRVHGTGVKIAKKADKYSQIFCHLLCLKIFITLHENGKMSFCRVTAVVGCRKLLLATDKQMTASSEWVHILSEADLWLMFCWLFFDRWKRFGQAGYYLSLYLILLVFWKLSKWENEPFYSAWVRCSKHKTKIASWEASALFALPPGWLSPERAFRAMSYLPWLLLELFFFSFDLGSPCYDPCKVAVIMERKVGCDPNDKVLFPNHLHWGAFLLEGVNFWT